MYRELSVPHEHEHEAAEALANADLNADGTVAGKAPRKTLRQAVMQIIIADVSMSLDNVLAVAGAAQHHFEALIFGLALSVVMMGVAASFIAQPAAPASAGSPGSASSIILYVALRMVYEGADQLAGLYAAAYSVRLFGPCVAAVRRSLVFGKPRTKVCGICPAGIGI